jgi:hypothetical protein
MSAELNDARMWVADGGGAAQSARRTQLQPRRDSQSATRAITLKPYSRSHEDSVRSQ